MKIKKKVSKVPWGFMFKRALTIQSGLTDWEVKFLESLANWEADEISEKQYAKLEEIWLDHC